MVNISPKLTADGGSVVLSYGDNTSVNLSGVSLHADGDMWSGGDYVNQKVAGVYLDGMTVKFDATANLRETYFELRGDLTGKTFDAGANSVRLTDSTGANLALYTRAENSLSGQRRHGDCQRKFHG